MSYAVAIIPSDQYTNREPVGWIGKSTHFRRRATRIADDVQKHLKEGLKAEVVELTLYVRASLAQFGSLDGQ
jgi:hypothetical protein